MGLGCTWGCIRNHRFVPIIARALLFNTTHCGVCLRINFTRFLVNNANVPRSPTRGIKLKNTTRIRTKVNLRLVQIRAWFSGGILNVFETTPGLSMAVPVILVSSLDTIPVERFPDRSFSFKRKTLRVSAFCVRLLPNRMTQTRVTAVCAHAVVFVHGIVLFTRRLRPRRPERELAVIA